ncbi:MAG: type II secretion system protein E [Candidatus Parcubacteria bacterium]|nr:MAG: type II secretion system protein E [Candidatus Parcubacteria bacterium]
MEKDNEQPKEFKEFRFDAEKLAQELAEALNWQYFNLQLVKPDINALKCVPKEIAEKLEIVPIRKDYNKLVIGMVNPFNEEFKTFKESLEQQGLEVVMGVISPNSLQIGLDEYRFLAVPKVSYLKTFDVDQKVLFQFGQEIKNKEELNLKVKEIIEEDPFISFDYILAGAIKFNASDIHFEPEETKIVIRYRIDGLLYDIIDLPTNIYDLIKNRIKVLSNLMINIKNKPQDGRFSITVNDQKYDIRVSFLPASSDEAIVLRILRFEQINKSLKDLGLREDDYEILDFMIHQPNGLILNTGPTGSGKTTTLYAILMTIKKPELKIITIENPIEYKIEGISQSQTDEARGFTFASALRSFLRHDPDVILVGEIRDKETAEIAIQASLTGHLVLSTLHTNNSLGAIPRLISLDVNVKLIPSALRLVIAQRLLRKVCPYCAEEYQPQFELKTKISDLLKNLPSRVNLGNINFDNFSLVKSKGCEKCFGTGYQGRIGIYEFLRVTKQLEEVIYRNPSEAEIYKAITNDFVTLQQDGVIKALFKITTIEEVERVTGPLGLAV